ncbi:MAG: CBS domain-containing protein [Myxococcota bacterium]
MGDQHIAEKIESDRRREFTRALLEDVHTLEQLVAEGKFETGVRRIGAEQEMFLIDGAMRPAPIATDVLSAAQDPRLTTELARFNLEANLSPRIFRGDCLRKMQQEIEQVIDLARMNAVPHRGQVLLAGILPTLTKRDLGLDNMTPKPRYFALNDAIVAERGGDFRVYIRGLDEFNTTHSNVMLESCNTSFQLHLQVEPEEFAAMYNLAQAITGPVLAAAVNSPTLLRHRLWAETRVALFETAIDGRNDARRENGHRARVFFGEDWVQDSVVELFRDNISHFRVVLIGEDDPESSSAALAMGRVPRLTAMCMHSGTVYRWNRVCYGLNDGVAHLRIENRVLPAGPTVLDEMANAAFFFGLMMGLKDEERIDRRMRFDDAKANFFAASRHGMDAQLRWVGGQCWPVSVLIKSELLPAARAGLEKMKVDSADIDEYLGVLEERVRVGRTGARWVFDSLAEMNGHSPELKFRALTHAMVDGQASGTPVHKWPLASVTEGAESWRESFSTAGRIMTTQHFSVRSDDIVDLAANLMDWHQVRHVPVEDGEGRLVGLVSHRAILRMFARGLPARQKEVLVQHVMRHDPMTASVDTPTIEAMQIMREHKVSCLPIVGPNKRLVGLVTERDLMIVSARLLERFLAPAPASP